MRTNVILLTVLAIAVVLLICCIAWILYPMTYAPIPDNPFDTVTPARMFHR